MPRSIFAFRFYDRADIQMFTFLLLARSARLFLSTRVWPPTLADGVARIFIPKLLCSDWELNSRQLSCTSTRDLNSGHFTN